MSVDSERSKHQLTVFRTANEILMKRIVKEWINDRIHVENSESANQTLTAAFH